jgi:signal transduction histidine kinase
VLADHSVIIDIDIAILPAIVAVIIMATRAELISLVARFYRIDRGRSRMQGGSGLGLAIAQSIAHMHGGETTVSSAVGQGSTFMVRLPVSYQRAQDEHTNVPLSPQVHLA